MVRGVEKIALSKGVDYDLWRKNDTLNQYVAWVADNGPQQTDEKSTRWPRKYRSNREITFVNASILGAALCWSTNQLCAGCGQRNGHNPMLDFSLGSASRLMESTF